MYKIEFLPITKEDIDNTIYYISYNLKNVPASRKLRDLIMKSLDDIIEFPYGCSIYKALGTLKHEYRSYKIKNFLMFYTINEEKKLITIVRVLYQKMAISNSLE